MTLNPMVTVQTGYRGFSGKALTQMVKNDAAAAPSRYHSICGPHSGRVIAKLDWEYADTPVCVSLHTTSGEPVAVGYATPIYLKSRPAPGLPYRGINLSYAVHSEHEGRGYGLAAASLAIIEAATVWVELFRRDAFLNIQTRLENVRSTALMSRLRGDATFKAAVFKVAIPQKAPLLYVGERFSLQHALAMANQNLGAITFLCDQPQQESSLDDEISTNEVMQCPWS